MINHNVYSQQNQTNFRSPIGIPIILSGNFGELRTNHFHTGLDIKTNGTINYRIYAVEDGFVSRIKISHWGYGKAIYVDHPNGLTSVYAHLDHFPKKIEQFIRKEQYQKKSEEVDFTLVKNTIRVEKGEVIAYSGNTGGSSGPHLHFEIRETKTELPLNPQLYGIDVKDHTPPILRNLRVYSLRKDDLFLMGQEQYTLKKTNQSYILTTDKPLLISGNVGLGLSAIDRYDLAQNRCGIYSIKVWIDGKLAYDYEGPTNWGKKKHKGHFRNKCYFKFGIYSNANLKADHKHEAEGMTVFTDYMAMAKTEEKLEELLLKDK